MAFKNGHSMNLFSKMTCQKGYELSETFPNNEWLIEVDNCAALFFIYKQIM